MAMPPQPPGTPLSPQQNLDTGIFVEGEIPQEVSDAIKITKAVIQLLRYAGIIGTLPKIPINIQSKGQNQLEVKLTFTHTVQEIREGVEAAIRVVLVAGGLCFLAGGAIGYSCGRSTNSPNSSISQSQTN